MIASWPFVTPIGKTPISGIRPRVIRIASPTIFITPASEPAENTHTLDESAAETSPRSSEARCRCVSAKFCAPPVTVMSS